MGNATDLSSNLTLLGVVASENPADPGRAITFELNEVAITDVGTAPSARLGASLGHNYPNPFNPSTTIPVRVEVAQDVRLSVYDSRGRLVRVLLERHLQAGDYFVPFEGVGLASGTYHYELRTAQGTQHRTMVLLK